MTDMSSRVGEDRDRVAVMSQRIQQHPELMSLIQEMAISSADIGEFARTVVQLGINATLQAEMDAHLGYTAGDRATKATSGASDNYRNGSYTKTVQSQYGPVEITMPRDRNGSFTPRMVPKGVRRITDVDDLVVSMYAGGTSLRDIQHHLHRALGLDLSHETLSQITDQVLDKVIEWQQRELEEFYPVIFLDALHIKVRDGAQVVTKACYMAIGITMEGVRQILGLWIANNEGAGFWAQVCAELANRGVRDVFIVCCDGLKGLPQAIEATWPHSMVQTCVVHLIRSSTKWVNNRDRAEVMAELKKIYTASTEAEAAQYLEEFASSPMGVKYPQTVKSWRDAWERFVPFLQFPPQARKAIYTTNAIESMNSQLRKATRNRGHFPNDTAAIKALWLMICHIEDRANEKNARKARNSKARLLEGGRVSGWLTTINQLAIQYPDRFSKYM